MRTRRIFGHLGIEDMAKEKMLINKFKMTTMIRAVSNNQRERKQAMKLEGEIYYGSGSNVCPSIVQF